MSTRPHPRPLRGHCQRSSQHRVCRPGLPRRRDADAVGRFWSLFARS